MISPAPRDNWLWVAAFLAVFALGVYLRVVSYESINGVGFDEQLYATYTDEVGQKGLLHYPEIVGAYIDDQKDYPIAKLPPTRMTFILAAGAWHAMFGGAAVESVRAVSCAAAILLLLLSGFMAWRMKGKVFALAVLALMTPAPTQIYMSHRALIDGFFTLMTFLVLWGLWELLQNSAGLIYWLLLYGAGLALLVLTKENAAFVFGAVIGLLIINRWVRFGVVSRDLLIVTMAGPVVGLILLVLGSGGFGPLFTVFSLNVSKSVITPYAIATGDGPWFRYLSDLLLVNPLVLILAIGGAFLLDRTEKAGWFLLGFVLFSYFGMCNVTYGMNLRYANMWDFPLCFLALIPLFLWTRNIQKKRNRLMALSLSVVLVGCFELDNYLKIFVDHEVYDPIPAKLLQALDILKAQTE
ncbi:MAG: phospholipid carrier-dependent glycosyltransferase [Methylacidiphilales bacterium]|nr:phospholipid carrier-dependent glycosyltransferase [Candidatus Methylacidiphilales bacterium]